MHLPKLVDICMKVVKRNRLEKNKKDEIPEDVWHRLHNGAHLCSACKGEYYGPAFFIERELPLQCRAHQLVFISERAQLPVMPPAVWKRKSMKRPTRYKHDTLFIAHNQFIHLSSLASRNFPFIAIFKSRFRENPKSVKGRQQTNEKLLPCRMQYGRCCFAVSALPVGSQLPRIVSSSHGCLKG